MTKFLNIAMTDTWIRIPHLFWAKNMTKFLNIALTDTWIHIPVGHLSKSRSHRL